MHQVRSGDLCSQRCVCVMRTVRTGDVLPHWRHHVHGVPRGNVRRHRWPANGGVLGAVPSRYGDTRRERRSRPQHHTQGFALAFFLLFIFVVTDSRAPPCSVRAPLTPHASQATTAHRLDSQSPRARARAAQAATHWRASRRARSVPRAPTLALSRPLPAPSARPGSTPPAPRRHARRVQRGPTAACRA